MVIDERLILAWTVLFGAFAGLCILIVSRLRRRNFRALAVELRGDAHGEVVKPGTLLLDDWEVHRWLGSGTFGDVYLCQSGQGLRRKV
jgi:hypothetical protein